MRKASDDVMERWIGLCENRAAVARCMKWKLPGLYENGELDDYADEWDGLAEFLRGVRSFLAEEAGPTA